MKRLEKLLFGIALVAGVSQMAHAQSYNTALGLRFGYYGDAAINVKHYLGGNGAIEGTIGGGKYHIFLEGLYEWNFSIPEANGLNWYLGLGANVYDWNDGHKHGYYNNGFNLGVRGVVGLEYTFDFPLNLAFHTGPSIGLINGPGYSGWGGSLAVRYAF